jgi:phosphopantothenoylcysteine decarboxylase/phosphopantothenate--cysteine ligase
MIENVIITSGPTIEPIDPVRFISNRSSGKTGFHIANEANARGIKNINFITGPTNFIPEKVNVINVERAIEMREEVLKLYGIADVLIMAAAVSDYSSAKYYSEKLKREQNKFSLKLVKNPDILLELGEKKKNQLLIGFAVETENIFENAQKKLVRKNLDLIVLNEVSEKNRAFDVDENQVYFITSKEMKKFEKMKKKDIAVKLWDEIERLTVNR